jgi:predicted RND superfamily exporter protein
VNLTRPIADLFERHWWIVAAIFVGMSLLAGYGHLPDRPGLNWESEESGNPQVGKKAKAPEVTFQQAETVLVVSGEESLFLREHVAAIREVVALLEAKEIVADVFWIDTLPVTNAFGLPEPLLPRADASDDAFLHAQQRALEHPLVQGQLVANDAKTFLIPITFDWFYVESDEQVSQELLTEIQKTLKQSGGAELRAEFTGGLPLFLAHQNSFDTNHTRYTIIGYVLVVGVAVFMFRGFSSVIVAALAPAFGIFWSMGILNLLGENGNQLTNIVLPVLISMVGMTDGIHLVIHIRRQRLAGDSPMRAAKSAIEKIGLACALTSLTTAIGFASLMMAQHSLIQGFGRGCAIGILVTFVAVITAIPLASTTFLGRGIHLGKNRDGFRSSIEPIVQRLIVFTERPGLTTLVAIVATVIATSIALGLRHDSRIKDSQPTGSAAYQAFERVDKTFGGVDSIAINIEWPEGVESDDPVIVRVVAETQELFDREELIQNPLSINRILESYPSDQALGDRMSMLELMPLTLKRMFFNSDARKTVVTARVRDLGMAQYTPVFDRVDDGIIKLRNEYPKYDFELIGFPVERSRNLYLIVTDLVLSLGTASVVIFCVMTFTYRSFVIGVISIVPNVFPLAVTGAVMYFLGVPLDVASVCAFTVCLGIAVDDTIHYLTRFEEDYSKGIPIQTAAENAMSQVGAPLVMTTIILVVGFATVTTSELPEQRAFASMACATISSALIGDLIFLPAMLVYFLKPKEVAPLVLERERPFSE